VLLRQGRIREAIGLTISIGDLQQAAKILADDAGKLAAPDRWSVAEDLAHRAIENGRWTIAIEMLAKYIWPLQEREGNKIVLRDALLRATGRSSATPDLFKRHASEIDALLARQPWRDPDWRSRISVEELGGALERIGLFKHALPFYQHIADSDPTTTEAQRQWARARWTVVKRRQIEDFQKRNRRGDAVLVEEDLRRQLSKWGTREEREAPIYPTPPAAGVVVEGLPENAVPQQVDGNRWEIGVSGFRLIVDRSGRLVLLTDRNLNTVRLDAARNQVTGDAPVTLQSDAAEGARFEVPERSYRGRIVTGPPSRVEIEIEGRLLRVPFE
jgi:tetratricopeptide (TPR) repeat protein